MNHIKMSSWDEKEGKKCFKNFHFIIDSWKNQKLKV